MTTYSSIHEYVGNGSRTRWTISFAGGYIDASHIKVVRAGVATTAVIDAGEVVITPAVTNGEKFQIKRITPAATPLVDFTDGASITEANLDLAAKQSIFVAAEAADASAAASSRALLVPEGTVAPTVGDLSGAANDGKVLRISGGQIGAISVSDFAGPAQAAATAAAGSATTATGAANAASASATSASTSAGTATTKAAQATTSAASASDSATAATAAQVAAEAARDTAVAVSNNGGPITSSPYTTTTASLLGRATAGTGAIEQLTPAAARGLLSVAAGATANSSDATLLARSNHTGTQSADSIVDGTTNKAYTAVEKTKLSNVAAGATANSADATLLARANHTGTQAIATVTASAAARLFGRYAATAGVGQEISIGANLALDTSTGVLSATGGATASNWGLFSGLASQAIPTTQDVVATSGHTTAGLGHGQYAKVVNGVTMNSAMATSHPLFVKADSNGTYRGLMPNTGWLGLAQAGYSGTGNGQPALKALLAYAKAIGCVDIFLDFASIDLWAPTRTSAVSDQFALDGDFIVVTSNLHIEGLPGRRTTINLKGTSGGSLNTQVQTVGGATWRGSAVAVIGGTSGSPGANNIASFSMSHIVIDGGRTTTKNNANAEVTHKGIRIQDTNVGRLVLDHVELKNFAGECYYMGALTAVEQHLTHCWFHHSDQSAFNPSRGYLWADTCDFGDAYLSCEVLAPTGGIMNNCRFYGGQATFMAGNNAGFLYNYAYPNRTTTKAPEWLVLNDCHFDTCGDVFPMNFVKGRIYCTDTQVQLNANLIGAAMSVDLEVHTHIDQAGLTAGVLIEGPATITTVIPGASAPNYIKPVSDVNIRLHLHRTSYAIANNKWAAAGFWYKGAFEKDTVVLTLVEGHGCFRVADNPVTPVVAYPRIKAETPTDLYYTGASVPNGATVSAVTATTHSVTIMSASMALQTSTLAGTNTVAVTPGTGTYPHGFTTRLYYIGGQNGTPTYSFARDGTRLRLNATRTLTRQGDYLQLTWDDQVQRWVETGYSGITGT